jgi:hypothetical protein
MKKIITLIIIIAVVGLGAWLIFGGEENVSNDEMAESVSDDKVVESVELPPVSESDAMEGQEEVKTKKEEIPKNKLGDITFYGDIPEGFFEKVDEDTYIIWGTEVSIGEKVGAFTVSEIDEQKIPLIRYSGTATVSGEYQAFTMFDMPIVCFVPDEDSKNLIPRIASDERDPAGFCFTLWSKTNVEEARAMLGITGDEIKGKATLVISDYVEDMREIEAFDEARLVEVISIEN